MGNNLKTYIFMGVITLVASLLLSFTYSFLRELIEENQRYDLQQNIVKSAGYDIVDMSKESIMTIFSEDLEEIILNEPLSDNFQINTDIVWDDLVAIEDKLQGGLTYFVHKDNETRFKAINNKKDDTTIEKYLPLFFHKKKGIYIIPISGRGLWSTLYGFISIDNTGNNVMGITFYKHKETPGLGGEVDEPWFQENFIDKKIFNGNELVSITVVKGNANKNDEHAVDGITGATITSKGVTKFLKQDLSRYEKFLRSKYVK